MKKTVTLKHNDKEYNIIFNDEPSIEVYHKYFDTGVVQGKKALAADELLLAVVDKNDNKEIYTELFNSPALRFTASFIVAEQLKMAELIEEEKKK